MNMAKEAKRPGREHTKVAEARPSPYQPAKRKPQPPRTAADANKTQEWHPQARELDRKATTQYIYGRLEIILK